jgi:hypothetical protein
LPVLRNCLATVTRLAALGEPKTRRVHVTALVTLGHTGDRGERGLFEAPSCSARVKRQWQNFVADGETLRSRQPPHPTATALAT